MIDPFAEIPEAAIDYVRNVFAAANDKVTRTMSVHPSMHEESLDHTLIMELSSTPPAFFAREQVGICLESHWLGGRHLYGRWEIADIAFFVILRRAGHLVSRKVALLQTKRLYSKEIPGAPIDPFDYQIGIGRLVDRTELQVPMAQQRRFRFDGQCVYAAMTAGHDQVLRIDQYEESRGIPVYYGFYNPLAVPYTLLSHRDNLTLDGRQSLKKLLAANKRLNTAYLLKESFGQLWSYRTERGARAFFERWTQSLRWQRLAPYQKFVRMIERHWDGIAAYCHPDNKVSLGLVEGLNNKIRVIQRSAYGYRDEAYLKLKVIASFLPALPENARLHPH